MVEQELADSAAFSPCGSFSINTDVVHDRFVAFDGRRSVASSQRLSVPSPQPRQSSSSSSSVESFTNYFVSFKPPDLTEWSLDNLKASHALYLLRIYHGLCFGFAIVMITGVGMNSEINLFLEFFETVTQGKGVRSDATNLLRIKSWVNIVATITRAVLLLMFYSGILLRGFWLLVDATRVDMFKDYRRTLCCEGSGPGCFPNNHKHEIPITEQRDLAEVHKKLDGKGRVVEGFTVTGQTIAEGSQLLPLYAMEGKETKDIPHLDLDPSQPVTFVFVEDKRPISFHGTIWDRAKARALWDMFVQVAVFATLDIFPIYDALQEMFDSGVFTTKWLEKLMTASVMYAIVHALIYFIWSSGMDYRQKYTSYKAVRDKLLQLRRASLQPQSSPTSRNRGMSLHFHANQFAKIANMELIFGKRSNLRSKSSKAGFEKRDSEHNVCVYIHNFLISALNDWPKIYSLFLASGWLAILVLIFYRNNEIVKRLRMFLVFHALVSAGSLWRGQLAGKLREWLKHLHERSSVDDKPLDNPEYIKTKWFQVYCSIDGPSATMKAGMYSFIAFIFLGRGIYKESKRLIALGVFFFSFAGTLFATVVWYPYRIWQVVLLATALNLVVILVSSSLQRGFTGFWQSLALCALTQLGLTRGSPYKRPIVVFGVIFTAVISVVAIITSLATLKSDGASFGEKPVSWCTNLSPDCKNFEFPVGGAQRQYQFCALGWTMGPLRTDISGGPMDTNAEDADKYWTVSERCNDTKLSVLDFAKFANIPYYLPSEHLALQVLNHDFPGWNISDFRVYNPSLRHYTTFAHFVRGSTHVIAIRGTWSAFESLHDLNYWLPAGFIQTAQRLGPAILDTSMFLQTIANLEFLHGKKVQFADVWNYTNQTKTQLPEGHQLFMTGHSLGGGLAQIVGALAKVPAITFSSPGLEATSHILSPAPTIPDLMVGGVNIVPENDLVPKVDDQVGSELKIGCTGSAMDCHTLQSTICELSTNCGDGRHRSNPRKYSQSCEYCPEAVRSTPSLQNVCPRPEPDI